jgi:hypothetical protein
MATSYGNPQIVTDGLVLCLDAANSLSYPGAGTSWRDISSNSNNGTLIAGPTFSSSNGGAIVFDGTNEYANCGNGPSLQINRGTISAWVKSSTPGSDYRGIVTKQQNYGIFMRNGILSAYDWGNTIERTTSINIADGTWKNTVMTFTDNTGSPSNNAVIYLNGSAVLTTTIKYQSDAIEVQLGNGGLATQYINGSIANALIYSRPLTASEVLQNYNAAKSRFGIV